MLSVAVELDLVTVFFLWYFPYCILGAKFYQLSF